MHRVGGKKTPAAFLSIKLFFFSVKHFSTLFCHLSGFFCRIYRRSKKRSAIFYRIYQIQQQRLYFTLAFHSNLFLNFFSGTIIAVSFFFPSLSPLRLLLTAVCNCVQFYRNRLFLFLRSLFFFFFLSPSFSLPLSPPRLPFSHFLLEVQNFQFSITTIKHLDTSFERLSTNRSSSSSSSSSSESKRISITTKPTLENVLVYLKQYFHDAVPPIIQACKKNTQFIFLLIWNAFVISFLYVSFYHFSFPLSPSPSLPPSSPHFQNLYSFSTKIFCSLWSGIILHKCCILLLLPFLLFKDVTSVIY